MSTSNNQGLPPSSSRGVFVASTSIIIDAPRSVVWKVLMDWGSYHEWNSFVRNQCLTDPSKNSLPASQQTPRAGAHLFIYPVHIPPSFDSPRLFPAQSTFQVITTVDNDNYRCAWENVQFPSWLLSTERWQALVEVVEDGRKKTRYETIEVFGGLLAYFIRIFVGKGLQTGFDAMAEGLKKRPAFKWKYLNLVPSVGTLSSFPPIVITSFSSMLAYPPLPDPHMSTDHNATPVYDPNGRQQNFVESVMQRRERIEFLKQREWIRRVTEWVKQTNAQKYPPIYSRSSRPYSPFSYQDPAGCPSSAVPFPCVEEEEEPYIIYSSSPSSSLSSLSEEITPVLPLNGGPSPSLSLPPAGTSQPAQRRPSGHHRRCSSASLRGHTRKQSLSSIYEVPEED